MESRRSDGMSAKTDAENSDIVLHEQGDYLDQEYA